MDDQIKISSYLSLKFYPEEGGKIFELKIPTFWEGVHGAWRAALTLPLSKKVIHSCGHNSSELEQNMIYEISKLLQSGDYDEEFSILFKEVE